MLDKIRRDSNYVAAFQRIYNIGKEDILADTVASAIASFERSLVSENSPFDRFKFHNESDALSSQQNRGYLLFIGRAKCVACHEIGESSASFTDEKFHSVGTGERTKQRNLVEISQRVAKMSSEELDAAIVTEVSVSALGRFNVTRNPIDIGAFKTPSLRNVALTPPYMHDGSVKTLSEALEREIYYRSTQDGVPLILTPLEKDDIEAFLGALSSNPFEILKATKLGCED